MDYCVVQFDHSNVIRVYGPYDYEGAQFKRNTLQEDYGDEYTFEIHDFWMEKDYEIV